MPHLKMVNKLQLPQKRQPGDVHRFSLADTASKIFPDVSVIFRTRCQALCWTELMAPSVEQ